MTDGRPVTDGGPVMDVGKVTDGGTSGGRGWGEKCRYGGPVIEAGTCVGRGGQVTDGGTGDGVRRTVDGREVRWRIRGWGTGD